MSDELRERKDLIHWAKGELDNIMGVTELIESDDYVPVRDNIAEWYADTIEAERRAAVAAFGEKVKSKAEFYPLVRGADMAVPIQYIDRLLSEEAE